MASFSNLVFIWYTNSIDKNKGERIMSTVHFMCGIPGCGKSTKAKEIAAQNDALYLSSDEKRLQLFGNENHRETDEEGNLLFNTIHKELREALNQGRDVVYDATNTNRRKRIYFNDYIAKGHDVIVHVLLTPFDVCLERNQQRERKVPVAKIKKIYDDFQMPFVTHGFKDVIYHVEEEQVIPKEKMEAALLSPSTYDELFDVLTQYPPFQRIFELPQDSTYHAFSVSRHTYYVWKGIREREFGPDALAMAYAGAFHDLGKGFTKSFYSYEGEELRYAQFKGHENVSTYLLIHYLKNAGYDESFILRAAQMVSYHMLVHTMGKKTERKLKNWLTEEGFDYLKQFNKCDNAAK